MKPITARKNQRGELLLLTALVVIGVGSLAIAAAGAFLIQAQHVTDTVYSKIDSNEPISDAEMNLAKQNTSLQLQGAALGGGILNGVDGSAPDAKGAVVAYVGTGIGNMVDQGSKPAPTSSNSLPADVAAPSGPQVFSGAFSGAGTFEVLDPYGSGTTCRFSVAYSGTITLSLTTQADGTYSGSVTVTGARVATAIPGGTQPIEYCNPSNSNSNGSAGVSGTLPSVAWNAGEYHFTGALSGNTVSGTMVETISGTTGSAAGSVVLSD